MDLQSYINQLHFDLADYTLLGVSILFFSFGWYFFFRYYSAVKLTEPSNHNFPPVSIIIAAKNAVFHLENNLQSWLGQDYPEFELVIVDDCSGDETAYFLYKSAEQEPLLKYVLLDPEVIKMGGKKLALTLGIKKAKYEHFLLTDADCAPSSDQWLKEMSKYFSTNKQVVLGVAPIQVGFGFLARLVHYENLFTALNYLGMAIKGKPYMGVGRNLAYTRSIYQSVGGFSKHHHIPAGDDDLFVQEVATAENTAICIQPKSYVKSQGPKDFKAYWKQKMRHLWVGKQYRGDVKLTLSIFPISQLLFWISIIIWFVVGSTFLWPLLVLLVKIIPEWVLFIKKGKLLEMPKSGPYYPFFNLFYSFWYVLIGIRAFFKKKIIW